ncbi:MAG: hypothetical protein JSS65_01445 [Armatimonadetes bacterium]|nr:hypothetical protein [Armatimonadota bacterium]
MKSASLVAVVASMAALLSGGCARLASSTDLKADGSWSRKVKVARSSNIADANPTDKLEDMVHFDGSGWKTASRKEKSDEVYEATRFFGPGQGGGPDYTLGTKEKPAVACSIKWTPMGDGRYLYEETFTWKGDKEDAAKEKENREKMRPILEKELASMKPSKEQIDKMLDHMIDRLWTELMGPNKPKLFDIVLKPEETVRELRAVFYQQLLDDTRAAKLGASEDERKAAARRLAVGLVENSPFSDKTSPEPPTPGDDTKKKDLGPVQITSSLGFVGHVLETNGEVDPVDNRIYWSIISEAPQRGVVIFRAVVDTKS